MIKLEEIELRMPLYYDNPPLHDSMKWLIARVRELEAENAELKAIRALIVGELIVHPMKFKHVKG